MAMDPSSVSEMFKAGKLDHLSLDKASLAALRNLNALSNPVLVFAQ